MVGGRPSCRASWGDGRPDADDIFRNPVEGPENSGYGTPTDSKSDTGNNRGEQELVAKFLCNFYLTDASNPMDALPHSIFVLGPLRAKIQGRKGTKQTHPSLNAGRPVLEAFVPRK